MKPRFLLALVLSAFSGYLALSYEIIWTRAFGVSASTRGFAFPMLLGVFLAGIAYGAKLSKRFTKDIHTYDSEGLRRVGWVVFASSIVGFLVSPAMAWYLRVAHMMPHFTALYLVFFAAIVFGIQFPLISHFGIPPDEQSGTRLSYFYVANIIGSVSGSLITGFILFNQMSLENITFTITIFGLLLSLLILVWSNSKAKLAYLLVVACTLASVGLSKPYLFHRFWENLIYQGQASEHRFHTVFESTNGVLSVNEKNEVYGSGIYDGTFNIDLINDSNGIVRAYAIAAFHPKPKKVLMIGLATGSWARVVANFDEVEKLTIIEIEPDYIELIALQPKYRAILDNPKVEIVIDDGRRWLNAHDEKFDFIISNTTYHWRAMATSLLSVEFFRLCKDHLNEGGMFFFNTTGSDRAYRTIFESFKYGARYLRLGFGSDSPITPDIGRFENALLSWKIDGERVYDVNNEVHRQKITQHKNGLVVQFENDKDLRERVKDFEPYTDDNMGDEFTGLF